MMKRRTFLRSVAGAGAGAMVLPVSGIRGANDKITIAVAGINGKGSGHIKNFRNLPDVNVIAVCDPDTSLLSRKAPEGAKQVQDYRELLAMEGLDAIVIATPNHWHAPMAIAACQAGKHVYVEKPVSHGIWEGRQMCEARKKYGRVVQAGTQQLTCPAVQTCGEDIRAGKYGAVKWVHCFKINARGTVGKRSEPMQIPENIDYNLWAGPAPMDPLYRNKFHYDWHWDLRWGDGEMGNWAVHYTSDLCDMLGWDEMPDSVMTAGGRFLWNDAADAPNMQMSMMKHKGIPLTVEIRNLPMGRDSKRMPAYQGSRDGNIIMCENAMIKISRGGGKAYAVDSEGRRGETIKQYRGNGGNGHLQNFVSAVKAGDHGMLNAPVEGCHISSGICHLSTISYKMGKTSSPDAVRERMSDYDDIKNTVDEQLKQCDALEIDRSKLMLGPKLTFDPKSETFTGAAAAEANTHLRYDMRKEFAVPEKV